MTSLRLSCSNIIITQQLAGIMLFPEDVHARHALEKSFLYERYAISIAKSEAKVTDALRYKKFLKQYKPSHEIIRHTAYKLKYSPTLAGAIFLLVIGTNNEIASISLAIQAIEAEYKCKFQQVSRRKLETLFQSFRSVAHLWAAHQIWRDSGVDLAIDAESPQFPCHPSQIMEFLGLAEYLRHKGENFKLLRDRKSRNLLDKNCTWRVTPVGRIRKFTDEDFCFISMHKILIPILQNRKIYGKKLV